MACVMMNFEAAKALVANASDWESMDGMLDITEREQRYGGYRLNGMHTTSGVNIKS